MDGNFNIVMLGVSLLVIDVCRQLYCQFLCPYGVILRHLSRLSHWYVTITPQTCHQCQICEDACPFGAITLPVPETVTEADPSAHRRLLLLVLSMPVIIVFSVWIFSLAGTSFSRMDHTVRLAQRIALEDAAQVEGYTDASKAFRDSGQPTEELFQQAQAISHRYVQAGRLLGGFIGLVIVGKLIRLTWYRKRDDYEADRASCLACARCFSHCPQELKRRRTSQVVPTTTASGVVTES